MTSSLLSLQPFAKMKIISFSLESRPNLYLPLYCLVQYHPFKSILSFSKCMSRPNEAFRPADGTFKILGIFFYGLFPYIHCKPHRHVPAQRIWFLRFFGLKTGIHFAHFGLELGLVFEGKKRRVSTYLSFQFQIKE